MKRAFWLPIAALWIVLPQLFIEVIGDFLDTTVVKTRILLLLGTGTAVLAVHLVRVHEYRKRLKDSLHEESMASMPRPFRRPDFSRACAVSLGDGDARLIPTEALLRRVVQPLLIFCPATDETVLEVFARLRRVYVEAYINRRTNPVPLVEGKAPIVMELQSRYLKASSVYQAVRQKVSDLIAEPPGQPMIERALVRGPNSVLLLIDARALHAQEIREWFSPCPRWVFKAVIALRPKERQRLADALGESALIFEPVGQGVAPAVIAAIEGELDARIAVVSAQLESPTAVVLGWIIETATAILTAELSRPGKSEFLLSDLAVPDSFHVVAELVEDWVIQGGPLNRRVYAWSKGATLMKDYLVASGIFQGSTTLDPEQFRMVNDSLHSVYVRPFLTWFSIAEGQVEHRLSGFAEQPAHRVIEAAWQRSAPITSSILDDLDAMLDMLPVPLVDWRDALSLLPRMLIGDVADKYGNLFSGIPAVARVKCILDSGAKGPVVDRAIDALTDTSDLWSYFEEGNAVPEQTIRRLMEHGTQRSLRVLGQTMIVAPHGVLPFRSLVEYLGTTAIDCWGEVKDIPIEPEDIPHVSTRVARCASMMPDSGQSWLGGLASHISANGWLKDLWRALHET